MKIKIYLTAALILLCSIQFVLAQEKVQPEQKKVLVCSDCGFPLNGKPIFSPKPEYPKAALMVRASGAVQIQIMIDENGNVESAKVVSGHPLLWAESVKAALKSKWQPITLSGVPIKVTGILVYNFVPNEPIQTKQSEEKLQETFKPRAIVGGIINGSAVKLEKPEYPNACRCAGYVFVQVIFDTITNKVESAIAVSGNPLLRIASIEAVKKSEFKIHDHFRSPNLKVVGFVVYRFGEPERKSKDYFSPEARRLITNYKKMDGQISALAAYSLDKQIRENLEKSPIVSNGIVNVKVQLTNKNFPTIQKLKRIGFGTVRQRKTKNISGKIAIDKLVDLADLTEVIKISS